MTTVISGSSPSITFSDATTQSTTAPSTSTFGFKNRIINGGMVIDQRNAGASVTPVNDQYSVDRWSFPLSQASKLSFQQNANSVTPPTGFINYLGITSLSAYSLGSSDYFLLQQRVEGLNMSDFGWGTANALTVTLSFWVRSSLTGTFSGSLSNSSFNRTYPYSYTISSANTWEYKTITIVGDTSGTWLTTNGNGMNLRVTTMGSGSTRLSTGGSWQAGNYDGVTGTTSVVGTSGATFYITGVQLEVGTQATSFDFRDYGRELMLCQRYYEMIGDVLGGSTVQILFVDSYSPSVGSTTAQYNWSYKQQKRTTPTVSTYGSFSTSNISGGLGTLGISPMNALIYGNPAGAGRLYWYNNAASGWYASAEL